MNTCVFELYDGETDTGMMVVGEKLDQLFRQQADAAGHPDAHLIDADIDVLLEPTMLQIAAMGRRATASAFR